MLTVETSRTIATRSSRRSRRFLGAAGEHALGVGQRRVAGAAHYLEFLRDIGRHFQRHRMLAAEAYRLRLEKGLSFNRVQLPASAGLRLLGALSPLRMHVADWWRRSVGKLLAGTDLVRRLHQTETYALTFPLITTASGAKMGKTAAGAVLAFRRRGPAPFDFYQYFVNVDDRDVIRFLKLLTFHSARRDPAICGPARGGTARAKQALATQ